ncbi:MAG: hypothetical protein R3C68_01820 [Myxococcota bacterium]
MREDSEGIAQRELEQATQRLRRQVVDAVMQDAAVMVSTKINDADRQRLLEAAIVELEKGATDMGRASYSEIVEQRAS